MNANVKSYENSQKTKHVKFSSEIILIILVVLFLGKHALHTIFMLLVTIIFLM